MSEDEYEKLVYDTLFLYYYVIEKFDENKANQYALGRMGQIFTDDGYLKRHEEKRLTGDWIVLYRKDNQNYYLTLARHEEPDEQIKERVVEALNFFLLIKYFFLLLFEAQVFRGDIEEGLQVDG